MAGVGVAVLGVFSSVLGIGASTLGLISVEKNRFPDPQSKKSVVRFQVGLDGTNNPKTRGLSGSGGNVPTVRLWNNVGEEIGNAEGKGNIGDGEYTDVTVNQDNSQQPTYGLFTAGKNAVCIAFLSITWPDSSKYGWIGNWAWQCGHSWYPSGIILDNKPIDCAWIDSNGDSGPETAFQVHFPEFTSTGDSYNNDTNYYCTRNPTMQFFTKPDYGNDHESISIWVKRDETSSVSPVATTKSPVQRRNKHTGESRIVVSHLPEHAATRVCESGSSLGPDFISTVEGIFCDMDTKTAYPLCKEAGQADCFDVETKQLRGAGGKVKRESKYSETIEWGS